MSDTRESGAVCPNCSSPVVGPYCPQCGQRLGAVRLSLRRILADALEDQFSVNAALPRTLKLLLIQPGQLTREYLNQRIARYIPPVRLYLISSVIFFLLLSFFTGPDDIHLNTDAPTAGDSIQARAMVDSIRTAVLTDSIASQVLPGIDSLLVRASEPNPSNSETRAEGDTSGLKVKIDLPEEDETGNIDVNLGNERLNQYFEQRIRTLLALPRDQMIREIADGFFENAPKVVFILLPIFAFLLKLLYFRRYYVEHFIFALHLHAFTFAIFTIVLLMPDWIPIVTPLLIVWIPIYTLVAMKRVYGQGLFTTVVKWWTLGVAYTILLSFGVVGALLAALATM